MEDERNTPQEQDEVEAHHLARDAEALRFGETDSVRAHKPDEDEDEVEAHARRESRAWGPDAKRE